MLPLRSPFPHHTAGTHTRTLASETNSQRLIRCILNPPPPACPSHAVPSKCLSSRRVRYYDGFFPRTFHIFPFFLHFVLFFGLALLFSTFVWSYFFLCLPVVFPIFPAFSSTFPRFWCVARRARTRAKHVTPCNCPSLTIRAAYSALPGGTHFCRGTWRPERAAQCRLRAVRVPPLRAAWTPGAPGETRPPTVSQGGEHAMLAISHCQGPTNCQIWHLPCPHGQQERPYQATRSPKMAMAGPCSHQFTAIFDHRVGL